MDALRFPMAHDRPVSRKLPPAEGPAAMVGGRVSGEEFSLSVYPTPRGSRNLQGSIGNQSLEGRVDVSQGLRRSTGCGLGGSFELTSQPFEGGRLADGWVGNRDIQLTSRTWGATVKIEGRVGNDRVVLTQWNQFDGHMLSGYIGNRNLSVQARNVAGEPPLEPMDYLPLLMNPEPESPARPYCLSLLA